MKKEMSILATGIAAGLKSAIAHSKGKPDNDTVEHLVMAPDVKAIREALDMSQHEFAAAYNIPLATLKGWEQGRRRLDTTAIAYLRTIAHFPKETRRAQALSVKTARHGPAHEMPTPA
jgi:putative transcriptional regulator